MSDYLFQLDQRITHIREPFQPNLSEAKTSDTNLEHNRLYSLEQQLARPPKKQKNKTTDKPDPKQDSANTKPPGKLLNLTIEISGAGLEAGKNEQEEENIDDERMNSRRRNRGRR